MSDPSKPFSDPVSLPDLAFAEERENALYGLFRTLGIPWTTHSHAPVFTVEEAQALRGALPGTHTKNLFLEDRKGRLWLVVAREELSVDLNALAKQLGAPRFSFGKPDQLRRVLGVAPGAVTPFALMNDKDGLVTAVFDEEMLKRDPVNFHPLRNDRTTALRAADLLRFARATGHEPMIVPLPERG